MQRRQNTSATVECSHSTCRPNSALRALSANHWKVEWDRSGNGDYLCSLHWSLSVGSVLFRLVNIQGWRSLFKPSVSYLAFCLHQYYLIVCIHQLEMWEKDGRIAHVSSRTFQIIQTGFRTWKRSFSGMIRIVRGICFSNNEWRGLSSHMGMWCWSGVFPFIGVHKFRSDSLSMTKDAWIHEGLTANFGIGSFREKHPWYASWM